MGYILELRKQVGHRPLIMTCAGVLLLNEKRELLLQKRADNGLWGYPGGSMELGDSFEDCARREVQEETGLICGNLEHFMNVSVWMNSHRKSRSIPIIIRQSNG